MRKVYIAGLVAVALLIIGIAIADEITFSTYYPAPFGQYREFSTTAKTTLATDEWGIEGDNARVGIGTTEPEVGIKLEVVGGPVKTTGGLVIETRDDVQGDPSGAELVDGRMWLRTDVTP